MDRQLAEIRPRRDPLLYAEITAVGFKGVETYVLRLQNTVNQYITTRTILELCLAADRKPGERVTKRLWWQTRINFGQEDGRAAERTREVEA